MKSGASQLKKPQGCIVSQSPSTGLHTTNLEQKDWTSLRMLGSMVGQYSSLLETAMPGCCRAYWSQTREVRIWSYYSMFPNGQSSSWNSCNSAGNWNFLTLSVQPCSLKTHTQKPNIPKNQPNIKLPNKNPQTITTKKETYFTARMS